MPNIPNPAEAVGTGAKKAAGAGGKFVQSLKGHKPVIYVGVVVFAIIIAYYIHQREANAAEQAPSDEQGGDMVGDATMGDFSTGSGLGSYGAPATYDGTVGTDGAFLGYGSPQGGGGMNIQDLSTLIDSLTGGQGVMPVNTAQQGAPVVTSHVVDAPTGGGPPARVTPSVAHATPPAPTHHVENLAAARKAASAAHKVPYPNFPRHDSQGWYRVEYNPPGKKKGKYHHYRNGKFRKVG